MGVKACLDHPISANRRSEPSALQHFFDLQIEQLVDREPILLARIVFCPDPTRQHQEMLRYHQQSDSQQQLQIFSSSFITYLRSEVWLIDYPETFTVAEIALENSRSEIFMGILFVMSRFEWY